MITDASDHLIEIKQQTECIVKELINYPNEIDPDIDLRIIGLDSVKFVELVILLEDNFNVFFDEDDLALDNFLTITNITQIVSRKL